MSQPAQALLNWLLRQDPSQVHTWIHSVWEGSQKIPEGFNWPALASGSALRAKVGSGSSSQPDLAWGEVAISIYTYMTCEADPAQRASFEDEAMYLRADLILKLGTVADDPILNVDQLVHWFFQSLTVSFDEAERKTISWKEFIRNPSWRELLLSTSWTGVSLEDIRELRRIKNRLSRLQRLSEQHLLPPNQELDRWLAIRTKLP
jgi:hypothetical protein